MKASKNFQNLNVLIPDKMNRENNVANDDFKAILLEAHAQNRITYGIYESGKQLESDPDDVMLCVLPSYSGAEATLHIHLTLIEAFCLEVGIQVVKVDDVESLRKLLSSKFERSISRRSEDEDDTEDAYEDDVERMDYNCLLVEFPDGSLSPSEEKLLDYCTYHVDEELPAFRLVE